MSLSAVERGMPRVGAKVLRVLQTRRTLMLMLMKKTAPQRPSASSVESLDTFQPSVRERVPKQRPDANATCVGNLATLGASVLGSKTVGSVNLGFETPSRVR